MPFGAERSPPFALFSGSRTAAYGRKQTFRPPSLPSGGRETEAAENLILIMIFGFLSQPLLLPRMRMGPGSTFGTDITGRNGADPQERFN